VTVSADMLMTHHAPKPLKVTVWDEGSFGCSSSPVGNVHIRVEDWNGNIAFAIIPDAAHPDVVLGDEQNAPGHIYNLAVTYVRFETSPVAIIRNRVSFFKILNAG